MEKKTAVVVGSGIAGLNTAFSLVEKGYHVKIVEKTPYIGGKLRQLDFQFPNDACGMCQIYPLYDSTFCDMCLRRGLAHTDIELYTLSEVVSVEGKEQDLRVKIRSLPRGVNENCTSCGKCEEVCPEYRFSEFNFAKTKAIYRDYPRNFPDIYTIDFNACTRCGKCVEVCPEDAINLNEKTREETVEADYVFVAPGIKERDLKYLKEFGVGLYPNVVISTHFERLLSGNHPSKGKLKRPSDGKTPGKIAFIQCMGSRDRENPSCSSICCMFTLKEVRLLKEYYPDVESWVFYMDMRTYTKGGYRYFKSTGAKFVNARPAKIEENENHDLVLYFEEEGKYKKEVFDLVVLSVGTEVQVPSFVSREGVYLLYDEPMEIRDAIVRSYDATLMVPLKEKNVEEFSYPLKDEYTVGVVDASGLYEGIYESEGAKSIKLNPLRTEDDISLLIKKLSEEGIDLFVLLVRSRFMAEKLLFGRINPLVYEVVDVEREQDVQFAVKRALLKLKYRVPPKNKAERPRKSVLVAGGGVAGVSAALEVAKKGFRVHVVEKKSRLGGEAIHVKRKMDGTEENTLKKLLEEVDRLRIPVYTDTEFVGLDGVPGNYIAKLKKGEEYTYIGVSSVVIASGASFYTPQEYGYGKDGRIITQREFEEDFKGIEYLKSVVMIQCTGSRNDEFPVCSLVCCRDALKNAILIKKENPQCEVYILYRDMMSYGKSEEYYKKARELGVIFIRYPDNLPPSVDINGSIKVRVHDKVFNMDLEITPDLVILSTGFRPRRENMDMARALGISLDDDGFFNTLNVKFNPIQTENAGVFIAGTALSPMTIEDAARSGRAAASKVMDFLNNYGVHIRYRTSDTRERVCAGCGLCVEVCPFGARYIEEDEKIAKVLYDICQACGLCVSACPSGSAYLAGEETKGILRALSEI